MILRRLIDRVRRQEWTAAGIELAIVVFGVFIGLQVSNWNEERRDRALAQQYLERLREDFVLSIKAVEESIGSMDRQAQLASLMIDRLRECRLDESQRVDFAGGLLLLGQLEPHQLTRGTIDELRSTGRIGIIGNIKLRQALSNVLQKQERSAQVLGFVVARRSAQLAYVDARSTFLVPQGSSGLPTAGQVLFDFPVLCRDPAYVNAVSHLRQSAYVVIKQNRRLLEDYRAMVRLVDADLNKEST